MPAPGKRTDVASFDFTGHMARLCDDVTMRHEAFQHIDMSRVAVCFAQARSRALHGLQAKLTPMRFEKGRFTLCGTVNAIRCSGSISRAAICCIC